MYEPEDDASIIEEYEEILRTKRKGVINVAYHQGKVFSLFRKKEKFVRLVENLKNVFKLIQKYLGLKRSSIMLGFLKNYFKDIKGICKENLTEFESVKIKTF